LTPLPAALGGKEFIAWRLEKTEYFPSWEKAEGAFMVGGRWSSSGRRVIYASLDPATTILEVAVHKGFDVLDTVSHALLAISIKDPKKVRVVWPDEVSDQTWLFPGTVSANQQAYGDALLDAYPFVAIPSVVSRRSWNLLIDANTAAGSYELARTEAFSLDTRLTPGVHQESRRQAVDAAREKPRPSARARRTP
jgi:RES domain-containing protein